MPTATTTRKDRRITLVEVQALRPCYDEGQLRKAFGRAITCGLTIREIARKRSISAPDRLWVLWRVLTPTQRAAAVERIVTRAIRRYALPELSTHAWAERWLSGEDRTAAAEAAAEAAAWAAAWAAGEAAWAAARAAEYQQQIADILTSLEG